MRSGLHKLLGLTKLEALAKMGLSRPPGYPSGEERFLEARGYQASPSGSNMYPEPQQPQEKDENGQCT